MEVENDCAAKILTKLDSHALKLEAHIEKEEAWQNRADMSMGDIRDAIHGNGKPGMKIQLDRLEQIESFRGRVLWLTLGGTIAAIVTQVAAAIGQ